MKEFSRTCSAVYLLAIIVILTLALIFTAVFITHPIIAAVGFAAIIGIVIAGEASLHDILQKPCKNK